MCPYAGTLSSFDCAGRPFVRQCLIAAFERYGLPARMTMDNGSPWGKDERFHRTLKAEVPQGPQWAVLDKAQRALDHWRQRYDAQRPHQALGIQVPQTRYQPSPRAYCPTPPARQYAEGSIVRSVRDQGLIHWRGQEWRVGKAFIASPC